MKNRLFLVPLCILLGLLVMLQGCNFTSSESSDNRISTVQALETSIAGTVTAAASPPASTPPVVQVQPTAPEPQTEVVQATQEVQVSTIPIDTGATQAALSATQAALAPIQSDLRSMEWILLRVQLGWIQPPLHLEVNQYHGQKFDNKFPMVIAQDFTMSSDITWNTQYGGSGCGFVFRSNGDQASPSQYMVVATRLASGHVFFAVMAQGEMMIVKDFYANGIDPRYDANNGATNRLAVVGNGMTFSVYTNGTKLGDVNPNAPLPPLVLPNPPVKPFNPMTQSCHGKLPTSSGSIQARGQQAEE